MTLRVPGIRSLSTGPPVILDTYSQGSGPSEGLVIRCETDVVASVLESPAGLQPLPVVLLADLRCPVSGSEG